MRPAVRIVLTGIVVLLAAEAAAHAQSITSFDPPGSVKTGASSINNAGEVTGSYTDGVNIVHGFIRDAGGTFTTFDPPGGRINDAGAVTGCCFYDAVGRYYGFIRDAGGTITSFGVPGAHGTAPASINNAGVVTGSYYPYEQGATSHGFIRDAGGTITSFDVPGSTATWPDAINDTGAVTGQYNDRVTGHGFIRDGGVPSPALTHQALSEPTEPASTPRERSPGLTPTATAWGTFMDSFAMRGAGSPVSTYRALPPPCQ